MSPALAKGLNVTDGDLVQVTVTTKTLDPNQQPIQRELVIAALISPGHADNSVTIPLGYGRKQTGPVGEEAGFNAYLLRTASNPHYIVADGVEIESVKVAKVAGTYTLSRLRRITGALKVADSFAKRLSSITAGQRLRAKDRGR